MSALPIRDFIVQIARDLSIQVSRHKDCPDNAGAQCGDEIYLGEFDDPDIEVVAFFHEVGHVLSNRLLESNYFLCKISCEGAAWEFGLSCAWRYGYKWEHNSKQFNWARSQLETYRDNPVNWK